MIKFVVVLVLSHDLPIPWHLLTAKESKVWVSGHASAGDTWHLKSLDIFEDASFEALRMPSWAILGSSFWCLRVLCGRREMLLSLAKLRFGAGPQRAGIANDVQWASSQAKASVAFGQLCRGREMRWHGNARRVAFTPWQPRDHKAGVKKFWLWCFRAFRLTSDRIFRDDGWWKWEEENRFSALSHAPHWADWWALPWTDGRTASLVPYWKNCIARSSVNLKISLHLGP